ncbi:hypothetical protein PHMEG_00015504 [Phytophthora megakarya]|uniref:RING-type domain-containing protein n=1 Tax=Phytophthora megakarya TaxID=4795 RepID=A0A225W376_9STRA|nr:hypothetical protein PHMEG_00015504 [Phytophthora megakarya]
MSSSNNQSGATAPPQQNFVFFMPPPPTVFVQFNDGIQMSFTPAPAQYLQSMLNGMPIFGSLFSGDDNGNSEGFVNMLNELFQRAQEQQHGPPPTSKPFLEKLPVKIWTQDMQQSETHTECVICLCDYEKDDKVISLPCGHSFHKECGMTWLVEHNVCPTCRFELPTQKENVAIQATQATQTTPVGTEPEQEPASETPNVTGVRRQRPTEAFHPRDVRQRVDDSVTTNEDAELDLILEEEADRFVKEEMEKRQRTVTDDNIEINDRDVDEFLNESSN